jgi:hypothetical protein
VPKHLALNRNTVFVRYQGVRWLAFGDRLIHSVRLDRPRAACVAKRFANRGLEVHGGTDSFSIPKPSERRKVPKFLLALFVVLVLFTTVAINLRSEPAKIRTAQPCQLEVGSQLPATASVLSSVALGGLKVMRVECKAARYRVTVDTKGVVVESSKG